MARTAKKERLRLQKPSGTHRPVRQCAWTRRSAPQDELLRLVLDPSGGVFVDVLGRAPGRGVYLSPVASVVNAALQPKGLARLFRGRAHHLGPLGSGVAPDGSEPDPDAPVSSPAQAIAALVLDRATELVALARRAGQLEVGTDAVVHALAQDEAGSTLVMARDLGGSTARAVLEAAGRAPRSVRVRVLSTKDDLGARLGRGPTGVLLCRPGTIADRIAAEGRRVAELLGSGLEAAFDAGGGSASGISGPGSSGGAPTRQDAATLGQTGVEGRTTRYFE